jgi:Ni/Co efflux regulator RcnB
MRMLPMIVTLALGLALAAPAAAGSRFSARTGSASSSVAMIRGGGAAWLARRVKQRTGRQTGLRPKHRHHHGLSLSRHHFHGHHRHRAREPVAVGPPPAPVPPVVAAPVEPPPPPDPRGPLRLTSARGIVPAEAPYIIGEALPTGLPHVTLAWRQFDLPEPPPGQLYARVGRDVLLITATGRIVESVLPPG